MLCNQCRHQLSSTDKFCPNCGAKVPVEKRPRTTEPEPMFFVEKREADEREEKEKKPRRVIHLDEFNWDLEGYPTAPRKTEAVDFDWASVLEQKEKMSSPKPAESKREAPKVAAAVEKEPVPAERMPRTVEELLASLPADVLEIVNEPEAEQIVPEEEPTAIIEDAESEERLVEPATEEVEAAEEKEVKTLEQIMDDFGEEPIEEPTRLIDKSQMKTDDVDRFYVFSKKQAEYQNLLDQEYDKIQSGLLKKKETLEEEPVLQTEEPAEEIAAKQKELELVAVVWSMPPEGITVKREAAMEPAMDNEPKEERIDETEVATMKPSMEEEAESEQEIPAEDDTEIKEAAVSEDNDQKDDSADESKEEPVKESITFAEIFEEDEDDEDGENRGGCLKVIAISLCILIIVELGIIGIQKFAGDSQVAKFINRTYGKIVGLFVGGDEEEEPLLVEEAEGPSEIETMIAAQSGKNDNIVEIVENKELNFEADKDYGYEELPDTYAFKNSPWYETEDGVEITYGDEIIGTLIQYYSALPDKVNDVNKDVLDYVDDTTDLYEELDAMQGDETRGYTISRLEIGELKTGQKGFYILVGVTSKDQLKPEDTLQKQIVYLEVDPNKRVIRIKETKNI